MVGLSLFSFLKVHVVQVLNLWIPCFCFLALLIDFSYSQNSPPNKSLSRNQWLSKVGMFRLWENSNSFYMIFVWFFVLFQYMLSFENMYLFLWCLSKLFQLSILFFATVGVQLHRFQWVVLNFILLPINFSLYFFRQKSKTSSSLWFFTLFFSLYGGEPLVFTNFFWGFNTVPF